ncbi:40S ribosomal protein S25 [Entamoeba marina]
MPPKKTATSAKGGKGGKPTGKNSKNMLFGKAKKSGGAIKKKSWSKTKIKEKLNNMIFLDQATHDKCFKEIPSMKVITPAVVSDRMKITCSLAKEILYELEKNGSIVRVSVDNHLWVYTRTQKAAAAAQKAAESQAEQKGKKGKKQAKK